MRKTIVAKRKTFETALRDQDKALTALMRAFKILGEITQPLIVLEHRWRAESLITMAVGILECEVVAGFSGPSNRLRKKSL
jgi:hypothetical protein